MTQCQRKRSKKTLDFAYALRSFSGHLEGTGKSAHTIRNYRSDLMGFHDYLAKGLGSRPVALAAVTRADLNRYHEFLKAQGFKTNTRRRKLMTLRKLLRYLTQRKKVGIDVGDKLPAPAKIERIPQTVPQPALLAAIRALSAATEIELRNRALLWALAETGCLVSEVRLIRRGDWAKEAGHGALYVGARSKRPVPISDELYSELSKTPETPRKGEWIFPGHNKFGALGGAISSRGVELLVRAYAERLGFPDLTPRTFRHSCVLEWYRQGLDRPAIQERLGLKTDYAFRVFEPLFKTIEARTAEKGEPA